jgi:hypothetical protein
VATTKVIKLAKVRWLAAYDLKRCLRRGLVHLIDTDLPCAMGIPEGESVESGAKDDDLPNPSFDSSPQKLASRLQLR